MLVEQPPIVELKASSRLTEIARNIRARLRRTVEDMIYVGDRLLEARPLVAHGQWAVWVEANIEMPIRMAQKWMNVAQRVQLKSAILTQIPYSGLLALAAPSTPDAAIDEVLRRAEEEPHTKFKCEEVFAVIAKYKMLEHIHVGATVILNEFGVKDGQPARVIPRSPVTSLAAATRDALERSVVEIDGIDHPIPDFQPEVMSQPIPDIAPLSNTLKMAVAHETARRQHEHLTDSVRYTTVVKRQAVKAFIAIGWHGTRNLVLPVLDVGGAFAAGETLYVTVERASTLN